MEDRTAAGSDPLSHARGAAQTVLVVDDDTAIVEFIELALAAAGYTVYSGLGTEALRIARDVHPHLILLDIMMPEMDGAELSMRLRADPGTADIPIIAMSAQDSQEFAGRKLMVNDRLPKPFRLRDLYGTVAQWCAGIS